MPLRERFAIASRWTAMHLLVAESETADQREARRASTGQSSGETYADTLRALAADVVIDRVAPADPDTPAMTADALATYDAVFLTGSPLHVYDDTPETQRQLAFMRAVFASGTPSFGSCAGLQLAVAAAGGTVHSMPRQEAGIARRISRTEAGADHPLLEGRGLAWDAPAIHGDEVDRLPDGARCLASNAVTRVQAAEIRHGAGVFWGVQYHPELALWEIAAALRRSAAEVVQAGLALTEDAVGEQADAIEALGRRPDRVDLKWRLGLDDEIADPDRRVTEIANFLRHLVTPTMRSRRAAALPLAAE